MAVFRHTGVSYSRHTTANLGVCHDMSLELQDGRTFVDGKCLEHGGSEEQTTNTGRADGELRPSFE